MIFADQYYKRLSQYNKQRGPLTYDEVLALLKEAEAQFPTGRPVEQYSVQELAEDLVEEAWELGLASGSALITQALSLWPDCLLAYDYLFITAKSKKKRLAYLEAGVEVGHRLFSEAYYQQQVGSFWDMQETCIYLRLLENLAKFGLEAGKLTKAIVIWEDMIRLDKHDHQGVRFLLMTALLRQGDMKSYHHYRDQCDEKISMVLFNDAWLALVEEGDSHLARQRLKAAANINPFILPLLLQPTPPNGMHFLVRANSPEEAALYAFIAWPLWKDVPAAQALLQEVGEKQSKPISIDGLPPLSLSALIGDPFSVGSPLKLRTDLQDEVVAQLPFLQFCRALLAAIDRAQGMKLTAKGNFPRSLVQSMYDLQFFPNKYVEKGMLKLTQEIKFHELVIAHTMIDIGRWVKKRNGKISLTKKGLQMLQAPPAVFYRELLILYTERYNWTYTEPWPMKEAAGQFGWGLVIYELLRQGDTPRSSTFYAEFYFGLFPHLLNQLPGTIYRSARERSYFMFTLRVFERFCTFFGLIDIVSKKDNGGLLEELTVRRSALAAQAFRIM